MIFTDWETATIDAAGTTSAEVDLGMICNRVLVLIPTLGDTATTTVHISNKASGTFYPVYEFDADATGVFAHATSDATTSMAVIFEIGAAQYIKIVTSAAQTAETSFLCKGIVD